ncbi:cobalt-precorrin 5A hydrolase [Paracoccus saliphilus]|uniref:Cobalamin biosynthesis protein n=2 Tax=Paracoccus saliphilus TaxID=405559 RepID=A0AA45W5U7_9RHOB|nr:cobalamin biosynthesis protein [Paracoccus saliphilus]SIS96578.1 cobalt-precorrin 5A hydrolase [Paracoccus saliphilus]
MKVAGFGCRPDTPAEALRDALTRTGAQDLAAIATIPARAVELTALAQALDLPLRLTEVRGVTTPTRSERVQALHETGSVAEAAALSACGSDARIIVTRVTSSCGRATAAIAESEETP